MKIGILTLHSGANYGGTLQCFALYRILQSMGHNVTVINFEPRCRTKLFNKVMLHLSCLRSLNDVCNLFKPRAAYITVNKELVDVFNLFRIQNLQLTAPVNEDNIASVASDFDAVVVGSDQVWGSLIRNKLTYFFDWDTEYRGKRVAYAACAISLNYPLIRRGKLKQLLSKFDAISVRDKLTQTFVQKLTHHIPQEVVDPTLLYDFVEFTIPRQILEPYILVYILGPEIKIGNNTVIKEIQTKTRIEKIVGVSVYASDYPYTNYTIHNANPANWVNLIANASYVYTDSYHGVLFALKYKIPFTAYYTDPNRASRLQNIMQNLQCREDANHCFSCDCKSNENFNAAQISSSISFLNNIL